MPLPSRIASLTLLIAAALFAACSARAELAWSEFLVSGSDGVLGIQRATDVAVSADGRHVYVVGIFSDSIGIFTRDAVSGALTFSDHVAWDGATAPGAIPDLDQPIAISLSSDGLNLYAAAGPILASRVVGFARDPETGALAYIQSLADGGGPNLSNLDRPQDILVSGDGTTVYVTSFENRAITVLARDPATGLLAALQVIIDNQNGVDGLEGLQEVAESPDGAFVYAASASRPVTGDLGVGGVATFARDIDGTLTFLEVEQQGVGTVDGLWAPRDVAVSPDGANVYVAAGGRPDDTPPGLGAIATFARELDGTLSFQDSIPESEFGAGEPRGVAVSPDGAAVYVVAYGVSIAGGAPITPGKLSVFERDAQDGALALAQRFDDNVGGVDGLAGALGITTSPDGNNVYVAASQDPAADPLRGAVTVFTQVPEPRATAASAAAIAAISALLQRASASQSRGRKNSS
jgi:DNA-binding beta-propeller fold protein YncE